jgi:hypothetical protein
MAGDRNDGGCAGSGLFLVAAKDAGDELADHEVGGIGKEGNFTAG